MRNHIVHLVFIMFLMLSCGKGSVKSNSSSSGVSTTEESTCTLSTDHSPVKTNLAASWTPNYSDLILYLDFDGDVVDNSGTHSPSNNAVDLSSSTCRANGDYGTFDDDADLITVGNHSDFDLNSAISVSAWIYWDGTGSGEQRIFERSENGSGGTPHYNLKVRQSDGEILLEIYTSASLQSFDTSYTISANTWYHLAYTYDGSQVRFFVNGVFNNSVNHTGNFVAGGGNDLGIGNQVERTRSFKGKIADFAIWSSALSDSNITTLYNTQTSE